MPGYTEQDARSCRTHLANPFFGEDATYSPAGAASIPIRACIERGKVLGQAPAGFDQAFAPGPGRYSICRVHRDDVPSPTRRDKVTDSDGVVFTVQQIKPEGAMWVICVSSDERGKW